MTTLPTSRLLERALGLELDAELEPWIADADDFARRVILAVCGAGVTEAVGRRTARRCLQALRIGLPARAALRHPGRAEAIDQVWQGRESLYRGYLAAEDPDGILRGLPGIGEITFWRLKRLVEPDAREFEDAA